MTIYRHKSEAEIKLQKRIDNAGLTNEDYRAMYWQLWGACSVSQRKAWDTFEDIT